MKFQSMREVRLACSGALLPVRVAYCPPNANGNLDHIDTQFGYISDLSASMVWVKFDRDIDANGSWAATTARGMTPQQLRLAP